MASGLDEIRDGIVAWGRQNGILADTFPAHQAQGGDPGLVPFPEEAVDFFHPPRSIVRVSADEKTGRVLVFSRLKIAEAKIKKLTAAFAEKYSGLGFSLTIDVSRPVKVDQRVEAAREPIKWHESGGKKLIACGSSIGLGNQRNAGTLTALARIKGQEGEGDSIYGISCNHVTGGCSTTWPGTPIVVPGIQDVSAENDEITVIGSHWKVAPMSQGLPEVSKVSENCDLSCFEVADSDLLTSLQGKGEKSYDTPIKFAQPKIDMEVKKWGRTTGFTEGEITAILTDHDPTPYNVISYFGPTQSQVFRGSVYFDQVIEVEGLSATGFSRGGDSGSLVVTKDGERVIGILIGGDRSKSHVLPLPKALRAVGLTLFSGHNL